MSKEELPLFNLSDPEQETRLIAHIRTLEGVHRVELTKVRNQRSLAQLAYLWAVVYPYAAKGFREAWGEADFNSESAHEFFKDRFMKVPVRNHNTGAVMGHCPKGSTSKLDTKEMSAYIEKVIQFCAEQFGIEIPPATRYEDAPPKKPRTAAPAESRAA